MAIAAPGHACPKCGNLVTCTCTIAEQHKHACRYAIAARLTVELACPHGYQACPICDPCTCGFKGEIQGVR